MSRPTLRRLHVAASSAALVLVASFLASTLTAELAGNESAVAAVKHGVVRALVVLVPALAVAALSGRRLAGSACGRVVRRKLRRMQVVAATGILVLVPCALVLDHLAGAGRFGAGFATVQAVELLAGASNLSLLVLNFRDGMAMRRRRTQRPLAREVG